MTRRDIVVQILSEASGCSVEGAQSLVEAMIQKEMIFNRDLEEEFSFAQAERLMDDFRSELPGIRRWLCEAGLLDACGHA
jgi:hypothetical protein